LQNHGALLAQVLGSFGGQHGVPAGFSEHHAAAAPSVPASVGIGDSGGGRVEVDGDVLDAFELPLLAFPSWAIDTVPSLHASRTTDTSDERPTPMLDFAFT